jgi:hypothetical protein
MKGLTDLQLGALTEKPIGAFAGLTPSGTPLNFAGGATKLFRLAGAGIEDVSRPGGYSTTGRERWAFVQNGLNYLATNYNDALQYITANGAAFADVPDGEPGFSPPKGRHLGLVGNFVVMGNCNDSIYGPVPESIWWSSPNSALGWYRPGSDLAVSNQSDRQALAGNGGWVQAVIGGAEVGIVFQERAIWRMDYRGGAEIFELNRLEPDRGCIIPGLVVPFSRFIFYLAEDGFHLFDYRTSTPIGKDRIDDTFFADYDDTYPDRVQAVADPDSTRIWVAYPGSGNTGGRPNRALIYDWKLNRFSEAEIEMELLTDGIVPGEHLDSLPDEDIDALPDEIWDVELPQASGLRLAAYDSSFNLSIFTGTALVATFESGDVELFPGRHACTSYAIPAVEGAEEVKMAVSPAKRTRGNGEPVLYSPLLSMNKHGRVPMRKDGRYHRFKLQVGDVGREGFTRATAFDVYSAMTGRR